jgi:hypothetical protein
MSRPSQSGIRLTDQVCHRSIDRSINRCQWLLIENTREYPSSVAYSIGSLDDRNRYWIVGSSSRRGLESQRSLRMCVLLTANANTIGLNATLCHIDAGLQDAPWCSMRPTHASYSHVKSHWPAKPKERFTAGLCVKGRNEPCHIRYYHTHTLSHSRCSSNSVHHRSVVCRQVLEATSAIFDKSQEELATIAYENTCRLFFPNGIPE